MTLDRRAADRRRFALVTGLADGTASGLPVGQNRAPTDLTPTDGTDPPEEALADD